MLKKGLVFNIQRFTLHDGPGIRTEFFLKGCPLRCKWCGNPESFQSCLQPGVFKNKCISVDKCGDCKTVCPNEDILIFKDGKLISIDSDKCNNCMKCVNVCPSDAIKQWGQFLTLEECMNEILKDKGFYEKSNGGVTISGGDPLLQSDFVAQLFKRCKEENIHTCFESTFYGKWSDIEKIIPYTDLLISDIKHMNTDIHKRYTGVSNTLILENLKKLITQKQEIILRIPVIPDINDSLENIEATADYIINELGNNIKVLQLLSFMHLGQEKYQSLGLDYNMKNLNFDRETFQNKVNDIKEYFIKRGINCTVGTKEQS